MKGHAFLHSLLDWVGQGLPLTSPKERGPHTLLSPIYGRTPRLDGMGREVLTMAGLARSEAVRPPLRRSGALLVRRSGHQ